MNDHEAQRIAAAVHELRPDWPVSSLLTLIRKNLMDKPRRDVCVAFAWVAAEPATSNPGRVLGAGPWWKAAGIEGSATTREPYDRDTFCDICGKPHGRHPEGDHEFMSITEQTRAIAADEERAEVAAEALEYARQAVGDAKAAGITPPPEREHKPSAEVEALRGEVAAAEVTG